MSVRMRHPPSAYSRPTHGASGPNFTSPSDRLYGSMMDIEPVTGVDLGQGSVTDGTIAPPGLDGSTAIVGGTLPSSAFDTTPPALPTGISVTSELIPDSHGGFVVAITVTMTPPPDSDFFATYIEATELNDNDPETPVPVWTRPLVAIVGVGINIGYVLGVAGATDYWVRLRSVDVQGNYSAYSSTYALITVGDTEAPSIPQGLTGSGGFKLIGLRWDSSVAFDLMHNEVRFAPDLGGVPDTNSWAYRTIRANSIVIGDLLPDDYWAQVRAVDYSRNVEGRWSATGVASTDIITCLDHTFVNDAKVTFSDYVGAVELDVDDLWVINATATTFQVSATFQGAALDFTTDMTVGFVGDNPPLPSRSTEDLEAGWSELVGPFTASLVGAADVTFNSVITEILNVNYIDAETIETGILNVATGVGAADGIHITLAGDIVGDWDDSGLNIRSHAAGRSTLDYLHLDDAALTLYLDGAAQSAITADGINANAVNFGYSAGGHNLVLNSSFELSQFSSGSTSIIGTGGSTLAGGVGGWVLVSSTNATLAAASVTMTTL